MGFFRNRSRTSSPEPTTQQEWNRKWAKEAEAKGNWTIAAKEYLEASLPAEALNAVRKGQGDDSPYFFTLTNREHLLLMKRPGILVEVVESLLSRNLGGIVLNQAA